MRAAEARIGTASARSRVVATLLLTRRTVSAVTRLPMAAITRLPISALARRTVPRIARRTISAITRRTVTSVTRRSVSPITRRTVPRITRRTEVAARRCAVADAIVVAKTAAVGRARSASIAAAEAAEAAGPIAATTRAAPARLACLPALFAALGRVIEAALFVELTLCRREDKGVAAVRAGDLLAIHRIHGASWFFGSGVPRERLRQRGRGAA